MQIVITLDSFEELEQLRKILIPDQMQEKKEECNFTATLLQEQCKSDKKVEDVPRRPYYPRPSRQKKIDLGKVGALRKAGWTVDKIADEFGVSSATIYNHLKKAKEGSHVNN